MLAEFEYCIALGANTGDREQNLQRAFDFLDSGELRLLKRSALYETEPWGFESEHLFMNACALVRTRLEPLPLLEKLKQFEKQMGRERKTGTGYTDRHIDLDIIACGDMIFNNSLLVIPHPQMHKRAFVLLPLQEIDPQWIHPLLGKTVGGLLGDLEQHQN
jgi:2-amino-4-hydroxy-6-hydroxymethyldihydropteridine diphosphokinase